MTHASYDLSATEDIEALVADLFAIGRIGYVAVGVGHEVLLRRAPDLKTTTTAASNFFEELLVNPTLLTLAGRRGALDCGGVDYIAVGYAEFTQLIVPIHEGHVSLGVSRNADARTMAARVQTVISQHGRQPIQPTSILVPNRPGTGAGDSFDNSR